MATCTNHHGTPGTIPRHASSTSFGGRGDSNHHHYHQQQHDHLLSSKYIYVPFQTKDYVLRRGDKGTIGLFANRVIMKGEDVFKYSLRYAITDVKDGDCVLLNMSKLGTTLACHNPQNILPTTLFQDTTTSATSTSMMHYPSRSTNTRTPSSSLFLGVGQKKDAFNVVPGHLTVSSNFLMTRGQPIMSRDQENTSSGIISYHVKIPEVLMNHSCNPNVMLGEHDEEGYSCVGGGSGEKVLRATRDIFEGEEITIHYSHIYYHDCSSNQQDQDPMIAAGGGGSKCFCGTLYCSRTIKGFKDLEPDMQQRLLPVVSLAVKAMHLDHLNELEKPLLYKQPTCVAPVGDCDMTHPFLLHLSSKSLLSAAGIRITCPPPTSGHGGCSAGSDVGIKTRNVVGSTTVGTCHGTNKYQQHAGSLYALRQFQKGEVVYSFWAEDWPVDGTVPVNIVFGTAMGKGDPMEGTSFWVDPKEKGYKDYRGKVKLTGFNMLIEHSCDPNIIYKRTKKSDGEQWQYAYAARAIAKGEILTADYNNIFWDRNGVKVATCSCKSSKCAGTVKGFKYISSLRQRKRWIDSDNGRLLSPHIRLQFKNSGNIYHEDLACGYDSDGYNSASDGEYDNTMKLESRDDDHTLLAGNSRNSIGISPSPPNYVLPHRHGSSGGATWYDSTLRHPNDSHSTTRILARGASNDDATRFFYSHHHGTSMGAEDAGHGRHNTRSSLLRSRQEMQQDIRSMSDSRLVTGKYYVAPPTTTRSSRRRDNGGGTNLRSMSQPRLMKHY